jgi:diaminohydroxyphosphoribosylaminopyrimidine deaminase/5-amino-6-(5-phosphoribosylamino)uracil reductase
MKRNDIHYMEMALGLAGRGLGQTWPNPSVGCVLVTDDGRIVGRGVTGTGGRPHGETLALEMAGSQARGASAFVNLEPCAHHGKTPPCAQALIDAGVRRVVVALADPDPRVAGQGLAMLKAAGIEVMCGIGEAKARALNAGFLKRVTEHRPLVTAKIATTLDGRIATHTGESKWITGSLSRARAHMERARHDAIMVGSATAIIDNPDLTCRLPGLEDRSPVRIVCDSRLRLPLTSKLVTTAKQVPTWLVTLPSADPVRVEAFAECGVEIIMGKADVNQRVDLTHALSILAERGLTRVMVEGGGALFASLFSNQLIDQAIWFRSPMVIGADGVPGVQSMGTDHLSDATRFKRLTSECLGEDVVETFSLQA